MDIYKISEFDDSYKNSIGTLINNKTYPPFGEKLDFNKISMHAINMCPTYIINNVNDTVIVKRNAATDVSENTMKPNYENKQNDGKVHSTNISKKSDVKRKKTKNSRIVAEYQASQIPDNKGSILSIDDLVTFINGNDKSRNHIPKNGYQLTANAIHKTNKKYKPLITDQRSQSPDDDGVDKIADISKVVSDDTKSTKIALVGPEIGEKIGGIETTDHDADNDDPFQVVRRKGRHKKLNEVDQRGLVLRPHFEGKTKPGNVFINSFDIDRKTIMVNDKESLNTFINKLWMEFQACYQQYIRDENKKIHPTKGY